MWIVMARVVMVAGILPNSPASATGANTGNSTHPHVARVALAAVYGCAPLVACIEQRAEVFRLQGGRLAEHYVGLVLEDGRRTIAGLSNAPIQRRHRGRHRDLAAATQQGQHLKHTGLAAAWLWRVEYQPRRDVEREQRPGVHDPQTNRDETVSRWEGQVLVDEGLHVGHELLPVNGRQVFPTGLATFSSRPSQKLTAASA